MKFLRRGIFIGKPVKYIKPVKYNGFSMVIKTIKYNFKCVCMSGIKPVKYTVK